MSSEPIIVDNDMVNSDWLKKFSFDVPGIDTFTDAEKFMDVPQEDGQARTDKLNHIFKNYQWVDALPIFEQPIIREKLKAAGKNNETD